jgi:hypothetical protein
MNVKAELVKAFHSGDEAAFTRLKVHIADLFILLNPGSSHEYSRSDIS